MENKENKKKQLDHSLKNTYIKIISKINYMTQHIDIRNKMTNPLLG